MWSRVESTRLNRNTKLPRVMPPLDHIVNGQSQTAILKTPPPSVKPVANIILYHSRWYPRGYSCGLDCRLAADQQEERPSPPGMQRMQRYCTALPLYACPTFHTWAGPRRSPGQQSKDVEEGQSSPHAMFVRRRKSVTNHVFSRHCRTRAAKTSSACRCPHLPAPACDLRLQAPARREYSEASPRRVDSSDKLNRRDNFSLSSQGSIAAYFQHSFTRFLD